MIGYTSYRMQVSKTVWIVAGLGTTTEDQRSRKGGYANRAGAEFVLARLVPGSYELPEITARTGGGYSGLQLHPDLRERSLGDQMQYLDLDTYSPVAHAAARGLSRGEIVGSAAADLLKQLVVEAMTYDPDIEAQILDYVAAAGESVKGSFEIDLGVARLMRERMLEQVNEALAKVNA